MKHINSVTLVGLFLPLFTLANDDFSQVFTLGGTYFGQSNFDKAAECYQRAIALQSNCPQAYFNLGMTYLHLKNEYAAMSNFKQAVSLTDNYTRAHFELAKLMAKNGLPEVAEQHLRKVIELEPQNFEAHVSLARILQEQSHHEEAIALLEKALEIKPRDINALLDLANNFNILNNTQRALELYRHMDSIAPNNPSILYNIAYTLKKENRLQEAMPYYARVLALSPNHKDAHFSYSLALLVTGQWQKGWQEYEWRWNDRNNPGDKNYRQPLWDGTPLNGRTLLIHAEQGLGDTYQFIRYAQIAKQMGGKVIVAVQNPLVTIIRQCPYIDQVLALGEALPHFDVHAPMLSLPYILSTLPETTPKNIPYLFAAPHLIELWRARMADDQNFRVGICWQGNPNYRTHFLRMAVAAKSMPVTNFLPIINMEGVSVYNLQHITGTDQLKDLPADHKLKLFEGDFDNTNGRFMDTAAVMKNLDLVITVDTSIAHLAAGLGVPVWLLLPNPADWRWLLDIDYSPWYPNMRLFRQAEPGDWISVIERVVDALRNVVL